MVVLRTSRVIGGELDASSSPTSVFFFISTYEIGLSFEVVLKPQGFVP